MITATVFENNHTQAVRLPLAVRYPKSVKKVALMMDIGEVSKEQAK